MSEWLLPVGTVIAAVALTYFFCVRPMRRGNIGTSAAGRSSTAAELDRSLDEARTELTRLRGDAGQDPRVHLGAPATTWDRSLKEEHR